jgi:hypothetical protein
MLSIGKIMKDKTPFIGKTTEGKQVFFYLEDIKWIEEVPATESEIPERVTVRFYDDYHTVILENESGKKLLQFIQSKT